MALPAQAILTIGIDDGVGWRKIFADLVMIGDENVDPSFRGDVQRLEARRTAVDRDDKLGAVLDQRGDRPLVRPIAFGDPVGNVDAGIEAMPGQEAAEKRGRRSAIDIVIAENRDLLVGLNSVTDARMARPMRSAAFSISASVAGSGQSARMVGLRTSGT